MNNKWIWIFQGEGADCCNAVYEKKSDAEIYIKKFSLSGLLVKMPLNVSVYQWVIDCGYFSPTREYMTKPHFIQTFNSAYLEHYHYSNGVINQ